MKLLSKGSHSRPQCGILSTLGPKFRKIYDLFLKWTKKLETKLEIPKTTSDTKSERPQRTSKPKTDAFQCKNRKTDLTIGENRKSQRRH